MNANAKRWVEALESGTIKQAKFALGYSDGSRCCLGVACDLAVEAGVIPPPTTGEGDELYYRSRIKILPAEVRDWLGLRVVTGKYEVANVPSALTDDNDDGKTFAEIAAIIRSEPKELFVEGDKS